MPLPAPAVTIDPVRVFAGPWPRGGAWGALVARVEAQGVPAADAPTAALDLLQRHGPDLVRASLAAAIFRAAERAQEARWSARRLRRLHVRSEAALDRLTAALAEVSEADAAIPGELGQEEERLRRAKIAAQGCDAVHKATLRTAGVLSSVAMAGDRVRGGAREEDQHLLALVERWQRLPPVGWATLTLEQRASLVAERSLSAGDVRTALAVALAVRESVAGDPERQAALVLDSVAQAHALLGL